MQPLEDVSTMAALDFASRFSNGDRALPLDLQAVLLFLEEDISQHGQSPEAQDGGGAHQLIVVQAEFLFAIARSGPQSPSARRYGRAASGRWPPDHWKPKSAPVPVGHPARDARSRSGSDRAYGPRW